MRIRHKTVSHTPPSAKIHNKKSTPFHQVIESQLERLKEEEMQHLKDEITKYGEQLIRQQTVKALIAFKQAVRNFIQEASQHNLTIKQDYYFSLQGEGKSLSLVEEVDKKLSELTKLLLEEEQENIALLEMIGEIKGLLVNIYQ